MKENSRNYRQYSYSETNVQDFYQKIPSSELTIRIPDKKLSDYFFKRFLMFIIHLSLIALFEIIFFFIVISNYENSIFINLVTSFTNPLVQKCPELTYQEKLGITDVVNLLLNITTLGPESDKSLKERNDHNYKFLVYSWLYFTGLVLISLTLIAANFLKKKKVKLIKVFIDNLFMIALLGAYEYLFFKTIILNYYVINNVELTKYIFENLSNCLLK
jgi:hypothetical protein